MKNAIAAIGLQVLLLCGPVNAQETGRVDLKIDSSEAEAVVAILDLRAGQKAVTDADWQKLYSTIPYQRLKKRESSMGRDFTDAQFQRFVLALDERGGKLRETLTAWGKADLSGAARRALGYLPGDTKLRAHVYPVIKPQTNSFVFESDTDAAIFLYLDPGISAGQFENTVAHELHHVGLSSFNAPYEKQIEALPENARKVARWMGAFGEGIAVLAAAGSPDVAPLSVYPQRHQAAWDLDMERVGAELRDVNQFFIDTIRGDLRNDAVAHVAATFYGFRGPWYTVGYRMATTIEKQFGRAALVETLKDPRLFVARYNEAARGDEKGDKGGGNLPLFSAEVLDAVNHL